MTKKTASNAFQSIIPRLDSLPLPNVMTARLLAAIETGCSARELKEIIKADPAIAVQVLRISNSAYFGQRARIQNIDRAILLLGVDEIRNICLVICLFDKFNRHENGRASNFSKEHFWKHSLLTARISLQMATGKEWIKPEDAFILGLLHDIGKAVLAAALPGVYDELTSETGCASGLKFHAHELQTGIGHTLVGSWISTKWGLPPVIRSVIEHHHCPENSIDDHRGAVSIVNICDAAVNSVMSDPVSGLTGDEFPDPEALDALNLLPEDFPDIARDAKEALCGAESMYEAITQTEKF